MSSTKPLACFTCHEEITFDKNIRSKTGKQIPLWPDKLNTHGHDEEGNPVRGKLPDDAIPTQKMRTPDEYTTSSPSFSSTTTQGGQTLDTKRLIQMTQEVINQNNKIINQNNSLLGEVIDLKKRLDSAIIIDSARYESQISILYDNMTDEQKKGAMKPASEDYNNNNDNDTATINHAKIADDRQRFMQQGEGKKSHEDLEYDY